MIETARRPRHLALLALALAFVALFVGLGFWQYGVAKQDAREQVLQQGPAQPVAPLNEVIAPHEAFPDDGSLRRVSVTGTYDAPKQFLVPDRRLEGRAGFWVLTPLVVDGTGARIPVLRGFVTDAAAAPAPPTGPIQLLGSLVPAESPRTDVTVPPGQQASVDVSTLLNEWGGTVYNAFLFTIEQTPAEQSAAMQHVPPPSPTVEGVDWRNLGYALQWWVFAVFALYLWWRSVREDHLDQLALRARDDGPTGDEPAEDGPTDGPTDYHGAGAPAPADDVRPKDLHV